MSRILVIPHAPSTPLRTRAGELARAMAALGHEVDIYARCLQPPGLSVSQKLLWHAQEIFPLPRVRPTSVKGLHSILFPTLHRGRRLARWVDQLSAIEISGRQYDFIFNSAYGGIYPTAPRRGKLIYELVDDHSAGWKHAGEEGFARLTENYVSRAIRQADFVIASSHQLVELARSRYGRSASLIPNGADVSEIRSKASPSELMAPTVGYIGGLDSFVRIDLVVRAIEKIRESGTPVALVIIGDGPALQGWKIPSWVKLLGFRPPPEIPSLLNQFQVGVVPFEISPYTDAALPLKVLEYGAARKITVSAPLAELKHHRLPWVRYPDNTAVSPESAWADALGHALRENWNADWDSAVDLYDWKTAARHQLEVCSG